MTASDAVLSQDSEGNTPLHLGVCGGYVTVTHVLLEVFRKRNSADEMLEAVLSSLLAIALSFNFAEVFRLLLTNHANVNHQSVNGETILYVAARSGHGSYVKAVLESSSFRGTCIDIPELVHGWTPLFIACIEGYLPAVKLLLQAGANHQICDSSGWTAKEHAAFRGHIKIAEWLTMLDPPLTPSIRRLEPTLSSVVSPGLSRRDYSRNDDESHIFVTFGCLNTRRNVKAVNLSHDLLDYDHAIYPTTGYSLEIGAIGATGASQAIRLPILEDMTNEPWVFTTKAPENVKLVFNIFRVSNRNARGNILVGSGIALLSNLKQGLATKRESLTRDYTIPILKKEALNFIGTVTFNFVTVTPFRSQNIAQTTRTGFWKKKDRTQIVGHRGILDYLHAVSN